MCKIPWNSLPAASQLRAAEGWLCFTCGGRISSKFHGKVFQGQGDAAIAPLGQFHSASVSDPKSMGWGVWGTFRFFSHPLCQGLKPGLGHSRDGRWANIPIIFISLWNNKGRLYHRDKKAEIKGNKTFLVILIYFKTKIGKYIPFCTI